MLLFLEIWLTIKAWRSGWNAWALIPGAIMLPLAFLIGATVDVDPQAAVRVFPIFLMIDLIYVGVLIGMVKSRPAWVTTAHTASLATPPVATTEGLHS